jgi:hypothetical protein
MLVKVNESIFSLQIVTESSTQVNGVDVATTGVITTLPDTDPNGFPFYTLFWNLPYTGTLTKDDVVTVQWQQTTFGAVSAILGGFIFMTLLNCYIQAIHPHHQMRYQA